MQLRLVHTLSLLLLGVILAAVLAFGGMLAWNLRSGFNDYLVARDIERLEQFGSLVAERVQRSGGLEPFKNSGVDLHELLEEFGQRQGMSTVSRSAFTARALRPSSARFNLTSKP
jgi:hypothetical protein